MRKPVRLRRRDRGERVEPPGAPRRIAYLYLLPALAVYAAFVLAPLSTRTARDFEPLRFHDVCNLDPGHPLHEK